MGTPAYTRLDLEKLRNRYASAPESRLFAVLADAYRHNGDLDSAVRLLLSGLHRHPDYVSARVLLAQCYSDLHDEPAAEAAFARVLELDRDNLLALRYRAARARQRGALDRAGELLRQVLEIDPFDRDVQADLGLITSALDRVSEGPRARQVPQRPAVETPSPALPQPEPQTDPSGRGEARSRDGAAALELPPIDLSRIGRGAPAPRTPEPSPPKPTRTAEAESAAAPTKESERNWGVRRDDDRIVVAPEDTPVRGPIRSVESRVWSELRAPFSEPPRTAEPAQPVPTSTPDREDEFSTLTLAGIYETQGYVEKALAIYDELHRKHPENREIVERLGALQRRLAGLEFDAPTPTPLPVSPPEPSVDTPSDDSTWRLLDPKQLGRPEETAEALRRVTGDVRSQTRSRRHTVVGTPPPADAQRAPSEPLEDVTRGHSDFERFLAYVRSLKP